MARRPQTWVIDLRHYVDEETEDLATMPGPAMSVAMFMTSIVAWVTDHSPAGDPHTNVWCLCRPGRKRCLGEIMAELRPDLMDIVWQCPWCGEKGVIRGWEHTLWDRRPRLSATTTPRVGLEMSAAFTKRQGQYLAFIAAYTKLHGRAPAEADMQEYFRVTPPSVHTMIVTLDRLGFIERVPGLARSIRVLVPHELLPPLD